MRLSRIDNGISPPRQAKFDKYHRYVAEAFDPAVRAAVGMSSDDAGDNVGEVGLGVADRFGGQYSFLNAK